jgi:pyruvate/2-oxoacid:ferredoxin oxidoreductase alpha subunit
MVRKEEETLSLNGIQAVHNELKLASPLVEYKGGDSSAVVVTMGQVKQTLSSRQVAGVGLLSINLYRPWPEEILLSVLPSAGISYSFFF